MTPFSSETEGRAALPYPFDDERVPRRGMPRDLELDLAAEEIVRQWLEGRAMQRLAADYGSGVWLAHVVMVMTRAGDARTTVSGWVPAALIRPASSGGSPQGGSSRATA